MDNSSAGESATSKRYMVSAPWRSSGKTMVAMGLAAAAAQHNFTVQTFKKGPDFIDPLWLGRASGRACYNLDFHAQSISEVRDTFESSLNDVNIALVEGTMGLHDGIADDGSDSNAAMARLLDIPVLLVVDCRGMHRTIAALLNGLTQFDPELGFAGVILNRVRTDRHASKVMRAISGHTDLQVVGALPEISDSTIEEKNLGLTPATEHVASASCIASYRDLMTEHCNVEDLFGHQPKAKLPESVPSAPCAKAGSVKRKRTIGIARDEAFHFYYQDDLDYLRSQGVELIELSPLMDSFPTYLDGLIIGGGFPERYTEELAANKEFMRGLKRSIVEGLPVHAECGGLMYLCNSMDIGGATAELVGAIDAHVVLQDKPVGRGYMKLARLGHEDEELCVHEFHHSDIQFGSTPEFLYRVHRGYGIDGSHDGVRIHNVEASYAHFRHTENTPWIDWFLHRLQDHHQVN